jgi:DNA repair protein RadD
MFTLRPYQESAVSNAIDCLKEKKNGISVLPTGAGKSLVIATIADRLGGHTLIFQPSKEILEQNMCKMEALGWSDIGVYSASCGQKDIGKVTFATIGSVVRKPDLFARFGRIIVDECHGVNSKGGMYESFISTLDKPTIGMTATPYRMRSYRDMRTGQPIAESRILTRTRPRIFQKISHITQVQELFGNGYLCPLVYDATNDYDSRKVRSTSTGQGFDETALERYNRQQQIPQHIADMVQASQKKHCLVFTHFRSESAVVLGLLREHGMSCEEVSAETPKRERENILARFRAGSVRAVINVGVLTTGFDFPELDCVIIGRPTKSVALYYQMVGRGVRIAPGKTGCSLIDLCDNVKRFGHIETFEIYDTNGNDMWRLRSDAGNLTGVDVVTGTELETVQKGASREDKAAAETGELVINFGKYQGQKIRDIDIGYIKWAMENMNNGRWKTIMSGELQRRMAEVI